jgi:hypothetical protein
LIDKQGISTGQDVRKSMNRIEGDLLLNYRSFFMGQADPLIGDVDFTDWENKQLQKLNRFKGMNKTIISKHIKPLKNAILNDLEQSYKHGINYTDKLIKRAEKKGFVTKANLINYSFFENDRIKNLLHQTTAKINTTLNNGLRNLEQQYMQTVSSTRQMASVSKTLHEAVDKSNKPLMDSGIISGITASGRRMNMTNQLELYTIELSQDVMFQGSADKRSEAGVFTVYTTVHASTCEYCTKWQGMILIDDVFQNGKPDGKHELLSTAIAEKFLHYGCRHNLLTFIEGVDKFPNAPVNVPERTSQQEALYKAEQRQRLIERNIRGYKRRELLATAEVERMKATAKIRQWQATQRNQIASHDGLYRNNWREQVAWKMPRDNRYHDIKANTKSN